ncbi:MAG TPA: type II toxin-antitoxin system RelE/ParE family toxin [Methyloceanibacter sp.]|nr:type II toxin-antitoxin system RelE/ParE family toxin [Methyloceanibacter sp.]
MRVALAKNGERRHQFSRRDDHGIRATNIPAANIATRNISCLETILLIAIFDMKTVAFSKAARRAWRKLPEPVQARIANGLHRYAKTGEGNVKRLANIGAARIRDGDYRVIFTETEHAIEIRAVGHRKDIYR